MVKISFAALGLLSLASEAIAQNVKVMPFGASIVSKCWRANLQTKLRSAGVTNFEFVGTQTGNCAGANIGQNHEGHPGSLATDYAKQGNLTGWLNSNPPDVIVMLLGTNDVLIGKKSNSEILAAYDTLIGQMRTKNPRVQIVFSNLLPLDTARWPADAAKGIQSLNAATATYAPGKSTTASPVYYVDNYSGFDAVKDTVDGEHPNDSGNEKMGNKFLNATKTAIQSTSRGTALKAASPADNDFTTVVASFLAAKKNRS